MAWSLPATPARAQDATWLASPNSNRYDFDTSWSTGTVPTGTASFGASNTTSLSLPGNDEANTTNVGGWTFNAGAGNYTFTSGQLLNFNGAGIVINGGSATINVIDGGVNFLNASTAGGATINNNNPYSAVNFYNTSTAGSATITSYGDVNFYNSSTAGSATITINYNGENGGRLLFNDTSSAGSATITNNMFVYFKNTSTAGSAAIANNGSVGFSAASTAGNATITNNTSNSYLSFSGTSTAGNAAIINTAGTVDFSASTGPAGDGKLSAGSIAGAGNFFLGARELTVGGNNLSTEVSGVISDCGTSPTCSAAGATGGSLVKIGTGTLTLSGANTYTGGTTINGGTLQFGNGGTSGSVAGDITDNAALIFDRSDTVNFGGVISGSGTLEKLGAGTLILQSANTYTGATTVSAGTLTILDSVASRLITNNATLVYSSNSTAGSAVITNNHQLTFDTNATAGSATLTNNQQLLFTASSTAGNANITNNNQLTFDTNGLHP
ncbi:autotransporter-associated beta strand repeat-containing protein [Bradyrhizobium sp. CCGUVB1N3]|uniref:beta strand repeat-containing protein n=1 Tax=Bradyrhizobium sp. CCGUVB1N3 TaxID=2949629 RepID=UPI0020B28F14|nr:autotransporter-associated beta strand repeat-containing protein [Bradyrhizobium sp. CCGUVB1N3]MCP3469209.1 autotransporter-associated beta strand repeat-containing protein [Bradyrhizobium sp. CCGUVB1N3]